MWPRQRPQLHKWGFSTCATESFLDIYHINKFLYGPLGRGGSLAIPVMDGALAESGCYKLDVKFKRETDIRLF